MSLMINQPSNIKTSHTNHPITKVSPPQPTKSFKAENTGITLSTSMANMIRKIITALQQMVGATSLPVAAPSNPGSTTINTPGSISVKENTNGTTTLNNATYTNSFLLSEFEKFKNSPDYPQIQTRDLRVTAWGYQGSGSALNAFYHYLLKNYPNGVANTTATAARNLAAPTSLAATRMATSIATPRIAAEAAPVTATTADTTATAATTSTVTPEDAVIAAAVRGNLSDTPTNRTAVSSAPGATV
ncbi:hypothetical protein [Thiofilum flexile]|uniref:hypothetical protein n=1 Tax=Thiofilum flexile TaxID=125627 RepID=UPI00036E4ED3|nr:hypothetical protein [Thiofilum flexile]